MSLKRHKPPILVDIYEVLYPLFAPGHVATKPQIRL